MNKLINIVFIVFILMPLKAQDKLDTAKIENPQNIISAQEVVNVDTVLTDANVLKEFKPNPDKVVWMAAIIPGYGQVMNRKYWKLPIVYGGFLGCAYAVSMNSTRYQTYKTAYRDIIDTDPNTNSFVAIIPRGYTIETYGGISSYSNTLKTAQDSYRRYRDLSIIASIGFYALTIIDAYVDAQLFDFDISPDLSMRFQPALLDNANGFKKTVAMQCSFTLK